MTPQSESYSTSCDNAQPINMNDNNSSHPHPHLISSSPEPSTHQSNNGTTNVDTTSINSSINEVTENASTRLHFFQIIILLTYPIIILLGQLVHISNPDDNYFSNKRNIFNVLFVKKAWLWTTIAYIAIVARANIFAKDSSRLNRSNTSSYQPLLSYSIGKVLLRYALATVWWILFSQWFFGLPMMDRVFLLTGGRCEGLSEELAQGVNLALDQVTPPPLNQFVSSAYCRQHGGSWIGGYDPSGHTFLLVHSSLFLWFELLPLLFNGKENPNADIKIFLSSLSIKLVLGLLTFWAWMLLMTAVYFHSFAEKLMGLLCAYIEVSIVYIALLNYPKLRDILGLN